MRADEDIREEIDRSFGTGPRPASVDERVARGHRALVRRRLLAGTGTALAVVALGGTAVVALGQPGGAGTEHVYAGGPSAPSSAAVSPVTPTRAEIRQALRRQLASYDDAGRLVLAAGVTVVQRIDQPYLTTAPGRSVALVLDYRGARYWYALDRAPDGSGGGAAVWSGDRQESFETWVRDQRRIAETRPSASGSSGAWPGIPDLRLVRFAGGTEQLEPVDGATILAQTAHVSVGDSFAHPGDQTAAAKVEAADGSRYYVLARRSPGTAAQYVAVAEADGGPTLAAFLDLARQRYAAGGGGLL